MCPLCTEAPSQAQSHRITHPKLNQETVCVCVQSFSTRGPHFNPDPHCDFCPQVPGGSQSGEGWRRPALHPTLHRVLCGEHHAAGRETGNHLPHRWVVCRVELVLVAVAALLAACDSDIRIRSTTAGCEASADCDVYRKRSKIRRCTAM